MRVVIAGGHGKIALRLSALLAARGATVVGLIRDPGHSDDLRAAGATPVICDLETAGPDEVAAHLTDAEADAVVFAAGAGPGSGIARKDTVDRGAAAVLADAAEQARVRRYLLVSSMGVEDPQERDGDEVFAAYLRAKLAAEQDLCSRDLDWTVLRPGRLTDRRGTGLVRLERHAPRESVSRDDVAAVLVALLDTPASAGRILELVDGDAEIDHAVATAARRED